MNNRRHSSYINMLMWSLCILFVLFVAYLIINRWFCTIELSNDVVPIDVASLLLTSFVTIFLGYYITKKLTESRVEKDSLIEDLKRIESYMYAVQNILKQFDKINIQQITAELEMAVLSINRFKHSLKIVGEEKIETNQLENQFFALYTISTNFDGDNVKVESVSSGSILKSSDDVLIEARKLIHEINTR